MEMEETEWAAAYVIGNEVGKNPRNVHLSSHAVEGAGSGDLEGTESILQGQHLSGAAASPSSGEAVLVCDS